MQALYTLAQEFTLLKLRVYVQFKQNCELPEFKGSMLHGWFGHALKAVDERAFFALYGEHGQQQPKPYIICPSNDAKSRWQQNEIYHFDISLFGQAAQLGPVILQVLQHGQALGFGKENTPFNLISVSSLLPHKATPGIMPTRLIDWLSIENNELIQQEIALNFTTPVRIKTADNILKHKGPDLPLLIKQIARRFSQLTRFWVCDEQQLIDNLYSELPALGDYQQTDHCYYENWQRYSYKQQKQLPFGGLKGQISYFGEISNALPWLQIGEQLHIGGKTTFGLGKYQLIY